MPCVTMQRVTIIGLVQALVVRDGAQQMVPSEELVPGDIVVLEEGV
jgi:magnesium-transporting ATPase (P-type)